MSFIAQSVQVVFINLSVSLLRRLDQYLTLELKLESSPTHCGSVAFSATVVNTKVRGLLSVNVINFGT